MSERQRGRTAVFEILRMNKNLEEVVLSEPVDEKIRAAALAAACSPCARRCHPELSGEIPFEEIDILGGSFSPKENTA